MQRTAFSTIPTIRRRIIENIDPVKGATLFQLVQTTGIPKAVLHRGLEEMRLLGVIEQTQTKVDGFKSWVFVPKKDWKVFFHYVREARIGGEND